MNAYCIAIRANIAKFALGTVSVIDLRSSGRCQMQTYCQAAESWERVDVGMTMEALFDGKAHGFSMRNVHMCSERFTRVICPR